jgi:hypothetical protein
MAAPLAVNRRWPIPLLIVFGAALLVLILYGARTYIAQSMAGEWLRQHGVASDMRVRDVSFTGLRAEVQLGRPDAPDLVVDELDVRYVIKGPWAGTWFGLEPRSVRLIRPRMTLRWDGQGLSYGSLTTLIDDFLKRPPNKVPLSSVTIEQGLVRLSTPYGPVVARGDATILRGVLVRFVGQVDPMRLAGHEVALVSAGGPLRVVHTGAALTVEATLTVESARFAGATVSRGQVTLTGSAPYPDPKARAVSGPVNLTLHGRAAVLSGDGGRSQQADLNLTFVGSGRQAERVFNAKGSLRGLASLASAARSGAHAADAAITLDLPKVSVAVDPGGYDVAGSGSANLSAASVETGTSAVVGAAAQLAVAGLTLSNRSGKKAWKAQLSGKARAARLAGNGFVFTSAQSDFSGFIGSTGTSLAGSLAAMGALDAASARTLTAPLAGAPAYANAARRALSRFHLGVPSVRLTLGDAAQLALGAPARLDAANGALLVISPRRGYPLLVLAGAAGHGALDLEVAGGGLPSLNAQIPAWTRRGAQMEARLNAEGVLDVGPAKKLRLQVTGLARHSGNAFSYSLDACAPLTIHEIAVGQNRISMFTANLCPAQVPLITADGGGWRAAGRYTDASALVAPADIGVAAAAGRFDLTGGAEGVRSGAVDLLDAKVADNAALPRFLAQRARGRLDAAGQVWRGRFVVATPGGHDLALVTLEHSVATGAGHVDVDAHALMFTKQGLQPASLSPLAGFAREAEGPVDFRGRFDWTASATTSSGVVTTTGLTLKSPLGVVQTVRSKITLTSLAPLLTAPGQSLTIERVDAVTPLDSVATTFEVVASAVKLSAASAKVAKGQVRLEPMDVPFGRHATLRGALVLDHVDLGELIAASSLADSVKVDAVVDGRLPFEVGPNGFHFLEGRISAVKPGRISIARAAITGVQTASGAPAGLGQPSNAVQDFAYQALENLAFEQMDAAVQSRPNGRLGVVFHIRGRHDPPKRQKADLKLTDLLNGSAFKHPIPLPSDVPIDLNLDTSLNFDELLAAFRDIWKRDGGDRSAPVQPAGG